MRAIRMSCVNPKGDLLFLYIPCSTYSDACKFVLSLSKRKSIRLGKLLKEYSSYTAYTVFDVRDIIKNVSPQRLYQSGQEALSLHFFRSKESTSPRFIKNLLEKIENQIITTALTLDHEINHNRN